MNILLTIFSSILYIALVSFLGITLFILRFTDLFRYLNEIGFFNGVINFISLLFFGTIILSIVLMLLLRKKLKVTYNKPLFMGLVVFCVILAIITSYVTFVCIWNDFDKTKWDNYPELRAYMTDSIKDNYNIIGMTKDEVTNLLGKPDLKTTDNCYEYYIGFDIIDPVFYMVTFEDEKVISVKKSQH